MTVVSTYKMKLLFGWLFVMSCLCCNTHEYTVTDFDGNMYQTVKIGKQIWMVENLKVTHFNNGDELTNTSGAIDWQKSHTAAYAVYNNDTSLKSDYGLLYNWYAVNDKRGLAPAGWRIPTETDIRELQQLILLNAEKRNWYLKEPSDRYWLTNSLQPMDSITGFCALPGGYRDQYGVYHMLKSNGYYWLEFNSLELYHWSNRMYQAFADIRRDSMFKNFGFSVKCIKIN